MKKWFDSNRKWLYTAMVFTFFWGLAAHGYGFLHSSFSHDSLSELIGSNYWKIQLGRVLVPFYKAVFRTELSLPWLVGLLSLLWIGLTVFLATRIFKIASKGMIFVIAGVFATNITVIANVGTYIGDYDSNMFALLCATLAVYLWREYRWGWLVGSLFVALSLGIYQSYVCVSVVLVIMVCILDLLNEVSFKTVMEQGIKAVCMLLLGGVLYYVLMNVVLAATGITLASGDSNSLDAAMTLTPKRVVGLAVYACLDCVSRLFSVSSPYSLRLIQGITAVLTVIVLAALVMGLKNKRVKILEKSLCLVLVMLLPLGMNLIYIPTNGIVHDLMVYAIWLFYLFALIMADWLTKKIKEKYQGKRKYFDKMPLITMMLISVLIFGNVQTANVSYLKKELDSEAFRSLMTRILYRIEAVEEYEAGITPVVFVGQTDQLHAVIPGFEQYDEITGMDAMIADMEEDFRARTYFQCILNNPALIPGSDIFEAMRENPQVKQMPCYPSSGSIAIVDGIMVVKLGDKE